MAGNALHLLVILLAFSHLVSLNAVPISRTRNLLQENQDILALENTHQKITEETMEQEPVNGRMDMEMSDYPGWGANNHHSPKPPLGRD